MEAKTALHFSYYCFTTLVIGVEKLLLDHVGFDSLPFMGIRWSLLYAVSHKMKNINLGSG